MNKATVAKRILASLPYGINDVMIEKSLMAFTTGRSSAKTLHTLASFNGIISWMCYEMFNTSPRYIAATSARTLLGIQVPRGVKAKEVVMTWVLNNIPSFTPEKARSGNIKTSYYDIADAIVVALSANKLKGENQ
jgi:hypothetical protein